MATMTRPVAALLALLLCAGFVDPVREAGIDALPDAHLPADARLLDQDGRPVTLAEVFGGPPLIFAAVQYRCPNLCGIALDGLFAGLVGAGLRTGRDVRVVVVGIDPAEGPAEARIALSELADRWRIDRNAAYFLTGPAPVVARVTRAMGLRSVWDAEHRQFAHISAVAITTADGRLNRWLTGIQFDPRALRLAVAAAGHGAVGTLGDRVALLCYGFDPIHGRYGWVVPRLLQAGSAATLVALALYLWISLRRRP